MRRVLLGLTVAWNSCYINVGRFSLNVSELRQWIKFHAPAIRLYYVPLSFPFDSPTSAVLEAPLETANTTRIVMGESSITITTMVAAAVHTRLISVIPFGILWLFAVHLRLSAAAAPVQTRGPHARRGQRESRERRWKSEGGYTDDAGGLLFSLLISSNLLIQILKPCYVVPPPPFMCRPELDKTQLYFTAFQPPAVHWSSIRFAFTLSLPGRSM